MSKFTPLRTILAMDFSQMRTLDNRRATDQALSHFLETLDGFYKQYKQKPSEETLAVYESLMGAITDVINAYEIQYHTAKFIGQGLPQEEAERQSTELTLKNFDAIPGRMRQWAAAEHIGDPARFSKLYNAVATKMDTWAFWLRPKAYEQTEELNQGRARFGLFGGEVPPGAPRKPTNAVSRMDELEKEFSRLTF